MSERAPESSRAVAFLRHLDPATLFFGPIFQKDMRIAGRKLGVYIGRSLYALILAVVLALTFYGVWSEHLQTQSNSARIQAMQGVAPVIVVSVLWVQFVALTLLAPVLTGGAICEERRAQTLPALLTTPLSPLQIVCSKGASRLAQLVIIALLSLPVLLGVRVFGGVRAETIIAGAALSLSTAIMGASLGLWFSARAARGTTATLITFCVLALIMAGLPLLGLAFNFMFQEHFPGAYLSDVLGDWAPNWPLEIPESVIEGSSPVVALFMVSAGLDRGMPVTNIWLGSTIWALVISLLSIVLASVSLRGVMRRSLGAPRLTRRQKRKLRRERASGTATTIDPSQLRSRRSRTVGDPSVLWREIRQSLFPSRTMLVVSVLAVLAIEGVMFLSLDTDESGLVFIPVIVGTILVLLQGALLSSSGFSAERETRTLDVLLTSRVSPFQLVASKMLGSIRRQWFIPTVLLAHMLVIVLLKESHPIVLLHLAIVFIGPIVFLSGTGVFFGLRFRKSITASALNLGGALAIWLVIPVAIMLALELVLNNSDLSDTFGYAVFFTSPVIQGGVSVEGAHDEFAEKLRDFDYHFINGDLRPVGWTVFTIASATVQSLIGLAFAWLAILRFEKHTGRTP